MKKVLAVLLVLAIGIMSGGGCGSDKSSDIPATTNVANGAGAAAPAANSVPVGGSLGSILHIYDGTTLIFRWDSALGATWSTYLDPTKSYTFKVFADEAAETAGTTRSSAAIDFATITGGATPTKTVVCSFTATGDTIAVTAFDNTNGTVTPLPNDATLIDAVVLPNTGATVGSTTVKLNTVTNSATLLTNFQTADDTVITAGTTKTTAVTAAETAKFAITYPKTNTGSVIVTFDQSGGKSIGTDANSALWVYASLKNNTTGHIAKGYAKFYYVNPDVKVVTSTDNNTFGNLATFAGASHTSGKVTSMTLAFTSGAPANFTSGTDFSDTSAGHKVVPGTYTLTIQVKDGNGIAASYGPATITVQ